MKDQPFWNGDEDKPCWGDPDQPFVGFKLATIALKKKIRKGETLQPYQPEMHKPQFQLSTPLINQNQDVEMQEDENHLYLKSEHNEAKLTELKKILQYLEENEGVIS